MSHTNDGQCKHCDQIRQAGDLIIRVTFSTWSQADIAHCLAYIMARIRRSCINEYGYGCEEEKEFVKWFNKLSDDELRYMNELMPIEPVIDENYDVRKEIGK